MARPAPATDRTVAILNFLAAHPHEAYGVSDLARRLDLNKATVHAQVSALADAGYLLRHPVDKTYTLGPALVTVGNAAAARQYELVEYARHEMEVLAEELGLQVLASALIGDEMVILARVGRAVPFAPSVQPGARIPLVPPMGTVFLAWAPPADVDACLDRTGVTGVRRARYFDALVEVRERGFAASSDAENRDPIFVGAPVFDADGRVALSLWLFGFTHRLKGDELDRYGRRLAAATRAVTASIHGREPLAAGAKTIDDRRETA